MAPSLAASLNKTPALLDRRVHWCLRLLRLFLGLAVLTLFTLTAHAQRATSTSVSVSVLEGNSGPYQNQSVLLAAFVSGSSPTGTVTFIDDGGTALGTAILDVSGAAYFQTRFPYAGSYALGALYSGDANNAPTTMLSGGARFTTITVLPQAVTSTTLQWLDSTIAVGQSTSFGVNVTGRAASARELQTRSSISLYDSTTVVDRLVLAEGVNGGTITTSYATAGQHWVNAQFDGTIESAKSLAGYLIIQVQKRASSVALTSSPASVLQGQPLTLTATVSGTNPTGSVTFKDGAAALGSVNLNASGVASLQVVLSETGAHSLTAEYGGDANHLAASGALNQSVTPKATTSTTLAANPTSAAAGDAVELTATVTGDNPGGSVTFMVGGSVLGSATLSSGVARLQPVLALAGDFALSAAYAGDAFNQASNSSAVALSISKRSTTTKLTVDPKPQYQNQPIKLTARVTGANPTGQVVFSNGGRVLGNAVLSSGQATLNTALADMGAFSLSVTYPGDANNLASASSSQAADGTQGTAHVALAVSPTPVVNYEYDAEGKATKSIVAPSSRALTTKSDYDALGRRTATTDAKQGVVGYGYDLLDQLTSVTDPRQLVTQYQPTGLGDVKQLTSPDTGAATSTFDAAGNLKTRTDARGVLATYTYDELDRPTQVVYSKAGSPSRTLSWTYDQTGASFGYGVGRLTTAATPDASTTFRYDGFGRVTMTVQTGAVGVPVVVNYGYDTAGNVTSMTYPSGRIVNFGWANGQPQSISITTGGSTTNLLDQVVMSPFGPVQSWVWKLGAAPRPHERVFDASGRPVRYPLGVLLRDITYDDADRVSRYTHYDFSTEAPAPAYDQTFSYDELNRLISATGSTNWSYTYDANGNRTSSSSGATSRAYTTQAASNRLDALSNTARNFLYDATGNTTSDTAGYTAQYSLEGRWAVQSYGISFGFDAMGRRVTRVAAVGSTTATTLFAYDQGNHLVGEYDENGTPITEYVWLGDTPVAVIKASGSAAGIYAVHADHLDTPRVILDANNKIRWRWMGEPFGASSAEEQPTAGLTALQQSLRFPGQQYEPFGGRHYNHFRDYDPTTGRYVQSDPIGLDGGINTYAYVGGNPLSGIDPYGLARIVGAPAYGPNFGKPSKEYQEWQKRYGQPMQRILDAVQDRIRGLCQIDRDRLQKEYDEWVVTVDPNIDNPARRIQQGYGITKGNKTTFSRRFFMIEPGENPSQLQVGWHEFRHTMPGNASIVDPPGSIGDILSGNAQRVPSEIDADAFADWLIHSSKTCGCPK
ncbi:Ig-like domain repeat protein [Roseateles saccharophilus]|uniref:Ig-like domain repeat protein n=1 Tax=Roseateles saccharophilus TaxID=304 RepID=UPI00286B6C8B|nr:Ig-like domain repeat protein [Roseateles saccharophilus]